MEACLKASNRGERRRLGEEPELQEGAREHGSAFRSDEYLWWQVAEYGLRQLHDPDAPARLIRAENREHEGPGALRRPFLLRLASAPYHHYRKIGQTAVGLPAPGCRTTTDGRNSAPVASAPGRPSTQGER